MINSLHWQPDFNYVCNHCACFTYYKMMMLVGTYSISTDDDNNKTERNFDHSTDEKDYKGNGVSYLTYDSEYKKNMFKLLY